MQIRSEAEALQKDFLILTLFNTLSSSFIWGINTLFLLDAGLNKTEAFAANAFFTAGMVLCDVPTGILADTLGRRFSFLLGSITLFVSTLVYFFLWKFHLPFWTWALDSILLGLGFTFFNGAIEAWIVDALNSLKFEGRLDDVFAKAQIVSGVAMFVGATLGGIIAQYTNLGVPFLIRCGFLLLSFSIAFRLMHDLGFTPRKVGRLGVEVSAVIKASVDVGLRDRKMRWVLLMNPILAGVSIYAFYAAQPYLLELYGKTQNYSVAGIAASLVALSQIAGGFAVPWFRKYFKFRTTLFAIIVVGCALFLCLFGLNKNFALGILILGLWGFLGAALLPIRLSYLNKSIPSESRATVLSLDSTLGSMGGVVLQPVLGKTADVWGFAFSFVVAGILQLLVLPFIWLAKTEKSPADEV
jgi:MFS family permease